MHQLIACQARDITAGAWRTTIALVCGIVQRDRLVMTRDCQRIGRRGQAGQLLALVIFGSIESARAAPGPTNPVVGGEPVTAGELEAVVAVVYESGVVCTGTLVHPDAVVTAAHCLDPSLHGDEVPSITPALDITGGAASFEVVRGRSKHIPTEFDADVDPGDVLATYHDIGVLMLEHPLDVVPLELLTPAIASDHLAPGASVTLVGYGLFAVDPPRGGQKHLAVSNLVEVGTHELLVSAPGQPQSCTGDSGGPALLSIDGALRVAGVVSRSADRDALCDAGAIDTRVDPHVAWLDRTVATHSIVSGGCAADQPGGCAPSCLLVIAIAWGLRRRHAGVVGCRSTRRRARTPISPDQADPRACHRALPVREPCAW